MPMFEVKVQRVVHDVVSQYEVVEAADADEAAAKVQKAIDGGSIDDHAGYSHQAQDPDGWQLAGVLVEIDKENKPTICAHCSGSLAWLANGDRVCRNESCLLFVLRAMPYYLD
jgi:hypothetical protein